MKLLRALVPLALLSLAAGSPAWADVAPEVELVAGGSKDLGGGGKEHFFDDGYLLGLRGVAFFFGAPGARWRLGIEGALDVMHYDWVPGSSGPSGSDPDALRERLLVGARLQLRLSPRFQIFGRALVGIDHYASDGIDSVDPGDGELRTYVAEGTALAAEVGLGARVTFGHVAVGLQCGLPVAFYRPPERRGGVVLSGGVASPIASAADSNLELHQTAVDLEGLLTVGLAF